MRITAFNTRTILTCLFIFIISGVINGQNAYEKGWQALDETRVDDAVSHFKQAAKIPELKEDALLYLTLLHSRYNREQEAARCFAEYFEIAADPYPALYALWFEEGVTGDKHRKKSYQLELLEKIDKDVNNKGKLDAAVDYRLSLDRWFYFNKKKKFQYASQIQNLDNWLMLGPFDNVMNSGFDKDFEVLEKPETEAVFTSKYGADIQWFDPEVSAGDGYFFMKDFFLTNNALVYTQTFVESPEDQDVILKFGYSGSLKVWVNDRLVYSESEHRSTELDYYRLKLKLNKGYNRILVQLGDYEESTPSFSLRFTDLDNNPLKLNSGSTPQPYKKGLEMVERIPHFATSALKKRVEENNDLLSKILLVRAYRRSNELNKAEEILIETQKQHPQNYFVLRNMILVFNESDNNTNQNKYYELYKEIYAHDKDILENEIDKYKEEGNKEEVKKLIGIYNEKYPSEYKKLTFKILLASQDEDIDAIVSLIEKMYKYFPDDYTALTAKYRMEKEFKSNPVLANRILEDYLDDHYGYNILTELVDNYITEGRPAKAIDLLEKELAINPLSIKSYQKIINIYTRQSKHKEAIEICEKIKKIRPSDYHNLNDLAFLHKLLNDEDKAIYYYNESLRYFPFSFETNENIRELKGQKKTIDFIPDIDPEKVISDFEANFKPTKKESYDIVLNEKSTIVFKSKATGLKHDYILRMNDESAIEQWQNVAMNSTSTMEVFIEEAKTIKKGGSKINAERNNGQVVFINLEIGDYIFVSYTEKQYSGGKSSVFVSDRFALNSYTPSYEIEYHLFLEEGVTILDTVINSTMNPVISSKNGFKHYNWRSVNSDIIDEETNTLPFNDIAEQLHFSLDYTWYDIVQWFSDLSSYQAVADYTIKELARELFEGKDLSEVEKARVIYDFVSKNIQYSSIDFRQSGYIPQKASKVYHSRLGDCKDVSTLYVAIARAAGLDADLVLINTSDNGKKSVWFPSLNFNHCIVNVHLQDGDKYLELTDPDLPFGYLESYHNRAAILEIPAKNIPEDIQLSYLKFNPGYKNEVSRKTKVDITDEYKMDIQMENVYTGTRASSMCKSYYYIGEEDREDKLKQRVTRNFKSSVSLKSMKFEYLEPRKDTSLFNYAFVVENDVLKLGSFRAFKIPFADLLIEMTVFEDSERTKVFDFISYENTDRYSEIFEISIPADRTFIEIPERIHAAFNGNVYELNFQKLNDQKVKVERVYTVNRENIQPEDFPAFKKFMTIVNEAENTHLLIK